MNSNQGGRPYFSVITPVYEKINEFLPETYKSLASQTFENWEWVILLNNGGIFPETIKDPRVRVIDSGITGEPGVGKFKRAACSLALGEVLVELDGDDLLVPHCLEKIKQAFDAEPHVAFVYSNNAYFNNEGGTMRYDPAYGWKHRNYLCEKGSLIENVCWPPDAHSFRRIEWSPDHVRAWRKIYYDAIGGHNAEIAFGDDHELMCRLYVAYGANGIRHIDEVLYLYRMHPENSSVVLNNKVQEQVGLNYHVYVENLAKKWAQENNLPIYDLGGRFDSPSDYLSVDLQDAHVIADLNGTWPFADNSVGIFRAYHIFEHLTDPIHVMNEVYRCLAPGGWLLLEVPSTDGRGAWCDPTHVSFWNERSIAYYTDEQAARYIRPHFKGRFQNARTITWYPTQWWLDQKIPVVRAELICLKDGYERPAGQVLI
jgi:glycosyltransferase involved in cell wall biosynthesis